MDNNNRKVTNRQLKKIKRKTKKKFRTRPNRWLNSVGGDNGADADLSSTDEDEAGSPRTIPRRQTEDGTLRAENDSSLLGDVAEMSPEERDILHSYLAASVPGRFLPASVPETNNDPSSTDSEAARMEVDEMPIAVPENDEIVPVENDTVQEAVPDPELHFVPVEEQPDQVEQQEDQLSNDDDVDLDQTEIVKDTLMEISKEWFINQLGKVCSNEVSDSYFDLAWELAELFSKVKQCLPKKPCFKHLRHKLVKEFVPGIKMDYVLRDKSVVDLDKNSQMVFLYNLEQYPLRKYPFSKYEVLNQITLNDIFPWHLRIFILDNRNWV